MSVLVTRPLRPGAGVGSGDPLVRALEKRGIDVIHVPTVAIEPADSGPLVLALRRRPPPAWVVVTTCYRPSERGKAQALNDFLIFGTTATSSFMAAFVQDHLGWYSLNWFAVALMMAAAGAVIWLRSQHRVLSPAY